MFLAHLILDNGTELPDNGWAIFQPLPNIDKNKYVMPQGFIFYGLLLFITIIPLVICSYVLSCMINTN